MVCETMGTLSIGILRVGYLLMSSFVGVEAQGLTAKQGLDFEPSRAKQIQFDPGVSQATWTVDILSDDLEENRERFKVTLKLPVNAVLGEYDQVRVVIKDAKDGVCRGETDSGGATITGTQTCCGPDGLPYLPEGAVIPQLPPGVPVPGQPLPPGGTHTDQEIPPGMPHPGVFPDRIPYPGGIPVPQEDEAGGLVISRGQGGYEEATGGGAVYPYSPQDGTHPGFVDGQDQPIVYPGQPYPGSGNCCPPGQPIPGNGNCCQGQPGPSIGNCCPPGQPLPSNGNCCPPSDSGPFYPYPIIPGNHPIPGNQQPGGGSLNINTGSAGQGIQSGVWSNGTHTRWTFHGIGSMPTNVQSRGGSTGSRTSQGGGVQHVGTQDHNPSGGALQHIQLGNPDQVQSNGQFEGVPISSFSRGSSGNTGQESSGNTGQGSSGNTGQGSSARSNTGQGSSGNTGHRTSSNTGHRTSGNTGQRSSSNTGQGSSGNTGHRTSGNTGRRTSGNSGQGRNGQNRDQGQLVTTEPQPHNASFTTRCTSDNRGEIYHDKRTAKVYQCDGQMWKDWVVIGLQRTEQNQEPSGCDQGWEGNRGRCYLMSNIETTWNEARRVCREQYGSQLVSILSRGEQRWINSFVAGQRIWIGLHDKHTEGNWEWSSNDAVTYTRWKPGAPHQDEAHAMNCAVLSTRMRWMDHACDSGSYFFVCMKPTA